MMTKRSLTIGDLAKATATKVETIRYYERIGLLPAPARTQGNYRSYTPDHLRRLSFVRRSRQLGFTIDQVSALLDLADQRDRSFSPVAALAPPHPGIGSASCRETVLQSL